MFVFSPAAGSIWALSRTVDNRITGVKPARRLTLFHLPWICSSASAKSGTSTNTSMTPSFDGSIPMYLTDAGSDLQKLNNYYYYSLLPVCLVNRLHLEEMDQIPDKLLQPGRSDNPSAGTGWFSGLIFQAALPLNWEIGNHRIVQYRG